MFNFFRKTKKEDVKYVIDGKTYSKEDIQEGNVYGVIYIDYVDVIYHGKDGEPRYIINGKEYSEKELKNGNTDAVLFIDKVHTLM